MPRLLLCHARIARMCSGIAKRTSGQVMGVLQSRQAPARLSTSSARAARPPRAVSCSRACALTTMGVRRLTRPAASQHSWRHCVRLGSPRRPWRAKGARHSWASADLRPSDKRVRLSWAPFRRSQGAFGHTPPKHACRRVLLLRPCALAWARRRGIPIGHNDPMSISRLGMQSGDRDQDTIYNEVLCNYAQAPTWRRALANCATLRRLARSHPQSAYLSYYSLVL